MEDQKPAVQYEVFCYSCKGRYDAMESGWCGCVVKERTLVCPSCLGCFCQAPLSFRQNFWQAAPQELWTRKLTEHRSEPPIENLPPDEVQRPLVLLVDDEREVRIAARRGIESLGYGLVVATSGPMGIEMAKLYRPQLVLSDALMPNMDGREMGLIIKEDPACGSPIVVIMTSLYTSAQHKHEAFRTFKADDYLVKPFDFSQLKALLQRYLSP